MLREAGMEIIPLIAQLNIWEFIGSSAKAIKEKAKQSVFGQALLLQIRSREAKRPLSPLK